MNAPPPIFNEHMNRIQTAIALGKPDRVPVVVWADSFCAKHMKVKMSDFVNDHELACDTMIQSLTSLGDLDGTEAVIPAARFMSLGYLCDMKLPGRELPEDSLWQLDEKGLMTLEDYDTVASQGFEPVAMDIILNRFKDKTVLTEIGKILEMMPKLVGKWIGKGVVPFTPFAVTSAFEDVSGARGMNTFYLDLYKYPEKVDVALQARQQQNLKTLRQNLAMSPPGGGVFFGLSRCASQFISRKKFERFAWPYIKEMVEVIVASGAFCYLHTDANWERDLDCFLELPKGRCVNSSDSATSIYKMKEVLGNHMCLMGDIPPSLFTVGTPDEMYNHCRKNIEEIGPSGYILSQSCTIPTEAKPENVAAMFAAAKG
jgi:uroporphyrinogen-III decarboxylase